MVEARAHHDHIPLSCVGVSQNMAQVIQIMGIAHRNQDVSGPNPHGSAAELLISINSELIELLGLAVALFGNVAFGECKDGEEDAAENHSGNCGFVLGKQ